MIKWNLITVNQGRNAEKRRRKAIIQSYSGLHKTPKGLKGKGQ